MGNVVELEGAASASEPGAVVELAAETSTEVVGAAKRKALWLYNASAGTIYLRFSSTGASATTAMPLPTSSGIIIKEYHGSISAWSEAGGNLHKAEF